MIIGIIFIPLSVKGNPKTEYLETNAVRVKNTIKYNRWIKKIIQRQRYQRFTSIRNIIKKLQEQVVFYMPHETKI